jgi:hypothetical protein
VQLPCTGHSVLWPQLLATQVAVVCTLHVAVVTEAWHSYGQSTGITVPHEDPHAPACLIVSSMEGYFSTTVCAGKYYYYYCYYYYYYYDYDYYDRERVAPLPLCSILFFVVHLSHVVEWVAAASCSHPVVHYATGYILSLQGTSRLSLACSTVPIGAQKRHTRFRTLVYAAVLVLDRHEC